MHMRFQRFPNAYIKLHFFSLMNFLWPDMPWIHICIQYVFYTTSHCEKSWKKEESTLLTSLFNVDPSSPLDFFGLIKRISTHAHFRISSNWLDFRDPHNFNESSSSGSNVTIQLFSAILLFPVSISQMEWKKFWMSVFGFTLGIKYEL